MSVIKPTLLHPERMAYLMGHNNYCWVYFRNGEKKLLAKPISYLEGKLPDFIRIHKTTLINPAYVKSIDYPPRTKMAGKVHLDSGEEFTVSRRRWPHVVEALQNRSTANNSAIQESNYPMQMDTSPETQLYFQPAYSIILITDDVEKTALAKQIIERKWPAHQMYTNQTGTHLPVLLKQLDERDYPMLIILDARTRTTEQLYTLQHLKEDRLLSRIPVVLLISPTDQLINDGYQYQANSIVPIDIEYGLFKLTIERICQFWLTFVTLPSAG